MTLYYVVSVMALEQVCATKKSPPGKGEARKGGAGEVRGAAQAEVSKGMTACLPD